MQIDGTVYVDEHGNRIAPPKGLENTTGQAGGGMMYPPIAPMVSDKAGLLDKIKPDVIVEVIRHKLMGEEFENGAWKEVPDLKERAISKIGAWQIANLMLPASSQNVSLSRLKDDTIRLRALAIAKQSIYMMLKNWKEYGIKGTDQIGFVYEIVFTNTLITLKQPENGGIRDLIKGVTSESRVYSTQVDPKRGWFPFRRR